MKFRFKLERALHFARLRETMQKARISAVTHRLQEFEARRQKMQETIRGMLPAEGYVDVARLGWFESKIGLDAAASKKLEADIVTERAGLEKLKASLGRLMRRTKALESLREKRLLDFRVEHGRSQQSHLDESFRLLRTAQSQNEAPSSEDTGEE